MAWKRKKRYYSCRKKWIRRRKWIICFIVLGMILFSFIRMFNRWIEPQLQVIAKQQSSIAMNNIVRQILQTMEYDTSSLLNIERDEDGYITNVDVDTIQLNQLLYEMLHTVDRSLEAAEEGEVDPTLDQTLYENGVIYQLPIGYLTHLPFLSNFGPKLNIRFRMLNDVSGHFQLQCSPYGVNNTLVELYLVVELQAEVLTVLSISEYTHTLKLPIIVEIIHGQTPQMYQNWTSPVL